jgi:hypothetical protein
MVYVCKVAVETTFINSLILLFNLQENMKILMFSICKINTIVFHKNCDIFLPTLELFADKQLKCWFHNLNHLMIFKN